MRYLRLAAVIAAGLSMPALTAQTVAVDPRARAIFKELIEINTTDSTGSTTMAAEAMAVRLRAAGFPPADVQVIGPNPRKGNLVVRYRGTGGRRPLLLLAHLDVVEAKREDWSVDPFTFVEKDGYFYGRGTTDDKAMAAAFVANLIRLKEEKFTPDRDLILALTADEEGGTANGVDWLLKNHRPLIEAEFAINEGGGGIIRKGKYLTLEVQASEKVYQDFRLEVTNAGGHSSLPVKENAISRLAAGLSRLATFEFPIALNEITRTYFSRSATVEADGRTGADMKAVGAATTDPAAAGRLAQVAYYNAMMRTTCVATRLEGGHANNALPQLAAAVVNCRVLPGVAPAIVKQQLIDVIADPAIVVSFIDEAQLSPPSPLREDVMGAVESITRAMFPGVVVVPVMSTGATDGAFLRNAGIPTYGVDGAFGDIDDIRAHGRDERMGVKQFVEELDFLYRLIKALASPGAGEPSTMIPIASRAARTLVLPGSADFLVADGEAVWITNRGRIEKLDHEHDAPVATVVVPSPCGVMAQGFGAVWVANCRDASVYRVDTKTMAVAAVIPTGLADPRGELSLAVGAGAVWALTDRTGVLSRIDPATNQVTAKIAVAPYSYAAAFGFDSVWVTNTGAPRTSGAGAVQRIDPRTNQVVATIAVGPTPRFLDTGEGGVWTLNQGDGSVSRIDPATNRVAATISVAGAAGGGGDIAAGAGRVWVRATKALLSVINPATNTVVEQFGPSSGSGAVRVAGSHVWVSAHDIQTVWAIPTKR